MNHEPYKVLIINWIDLINKLVKKNCINNVEVSNVEKNIDNNTFNVITKDNNNNYYQCKKVIFATTLKPLIKLTKNIINNNVIDYSKYIGIVPFVRIYCYYKKGYVDNLSHYTIVDNKLQKIIKINDNILMASYSDNSDALYWKKIKQQSKDKQINIVSKYLEELNVKGKIDDIVIAFWDEGVHYYKPTKDIHKTIKTLAKPAKNIYVVGEIVSYKQGWVEGAIQSVNDFYGYSKS
jgi:protoporphyrinogen oxidase